MNSFLMLPVLFSSDCGLHVLPFVLLLLTFKPFCYPYRMLDLSHLGFVSLVIGESWFWLAYTSRATEEGWGGGVAWFLHV